MLYLLDTDICVWALRLRDPVASRVHSRSPDDLAVASMTEAELRFGALKSNDPTGGIAQVEACLNTGIAVLPFDSDAARRHAEIRYALRAGRIGDRDLVIASVALANGLRLATGNVREFGRVPGLVWEDWTAS